jgi:UDP-N-acetylglucosamine 2-epimerase (non-hydrolysing)
MTSILHIVGARPNFMKMAPVYSRIAELSVFTQTVVHTGQHYDDAMSDIFFRQLGLPQPTINLGVGSGSHGAQTGQIMVRVEEALVAYRPAMVLVYGDVNSTVAAALVASKMGIAVAHVEAGLRSFDRTMPEEINRVVTDQIADLLFTPSADGDENLQREGIPAERVHRVGNVMIDTLVRLLPAADERWRMLRGELDVPALFGLVTLHRPSNVDSSERFQQILQHLIRISDELPLIFPVHPRTRQNLQESGLRGSRIRFTEPLGYIDFVALEKNAFVVITDSGGIQEETTYLGVPCLTLRSNTERPITVTMGTNVLLGDHLDMLEREVFLRMRGNRKPSRIPPLWDGRAGERIARVIASTAAQAVHS